MAKARDPALAAAIRALASERGYLEIQVTPNARATAVQLPAAGEAPVLLIRTTATPEDGKANRAVIDIVAEALGLARSRVTLAHGATTRRKRLQLDFADD